MSRLPDLEAWAVFARVVELGSFAQAADQLGLSKATVSKAIGRLEDRIGAALLNRTSRKLSLTDIGRVASGTASQILASATAVEAEAMSQSGEPRGLVRIAAPMSFGVKHIAPLLPPLLEAYPKVVASLHLSDAQVDLIGGGYDVAVRIASLSDSSLRAKRVCEARRYLVGSPAYFARAGMPIHPSELSDHACLDYSYLPSGRRWFFQNRSGEEVSVEIDGPLSINNGSALMPALLAGVGAAVQPEFIVWAELAAGTLQVAMPEWRMRPIDIHIVTPPSLFRPTCVDAVVDFLARRLADQPWAKAEPPANRPPPAMHGRAQNFR